ncbi:MAG: hypothetical protein AB7L92_05640 [Alphaproteobacteria bacterium]
MKVAVDSLYRLSMAFCRDREIEYRDALIEDLDHGGIAPSLLDEPFDREIKVYEPPVRHNPIRLGEIEFFAMASSLWWYHLYEGNHKTERQELLYRYMEHVLAMEPEWLGVFDYQAIKDGSFESMRTNRMTFYIDCIADVAPVAMAAQNLGPLYDHMNKRLLAHLGFNSWQLPEDMPDSRLFLFRHSGLWQDHIASLAKGEA